MHKPRSKYFYSDKSFEIFGKLNKSKKIKYYVFLCSAKKKFVGLGSYTFAHLCSIGYSKETVRKYLQEMIKIGWATKVSATKYVLKSYYKICEENGVSIYPGRMVFKCEDLSEIKTRVAYCIVERNCNQQVYITCNKTGTPKKRHALRSNRYDVTYGTNRLSGVMGYRSKMSGTNLFRKMKELQLCYRVQQSRILGDIQTLTHHVFDYRHSAYLSYDGRTVIEKLPCLIRFY
jgi:hypothetical protein